ncbi:MAG: FRG domain-containing protein [Lachnospiraceae bacterium]|nr:FRG domain-containing protein [Lachnospiraceae bacterium]
MTVTAGSEGGVSVSGANRVYSFIKLIGDLKDSIDSNGQRVDIYYETRLLFRGQSDARYNLEPSLTWKKNYSNLTLQMKERDLIETAKYMAPDVFRNDYQPLEQLAVLRHHAMPTRLLDVTSNALVALYFACCGNNDQDGEVIIFVDNRYSQATLALHNAIADTCRLMQNETLVPLGEFLQRMKREPYAYEIKDKIGFDEGWLFKCCQQILFVNAPFHLRRQQAQSGKYILFPNEIVDVNGLRYFRNNIAPIKKLYPNVVRIIRIPKESKEKIRQELEWMGIDEASLFIDSPDKMCEQIAKRYERELKM